MRLIHCSDIRLDSKTDARLSSQEARLKAQSVLDTFLRLVDYAQELAVDAVLIVGSLFDNSRATHRTKEAVLSAIAAASGTDFLYLASSPEEMAETFRGYDLPPNLKVFGETWSEHDYGDVAVSGIVATNANGARLYRSLHLDDTKVNIVSLYGTVSNQSSLYRVRPELFEGKDVDYLALGGSPAYHLETLDPERPGSTLCYSGILEGSSFEDTCEAGFVLLESDGSSLTTAFVPFAAHRMRKVVVDVSDCPTILDVCVAVEDALAACTPSDFVLVSLTGETQLPASEDLTRLAAQFQGRFEALVVQDDTTLWLDPASYEHDISLRGEYTRLVLGSDLDSRQKARLIRLGKQALDAQEITL